MKKLFYVIIGLMVGYTILCLFGPSDTKAERSIVINKPNDAVLHKLADLKFFHDSWSPWTEKDPNMKTTYTGECCEPGSSMSWESEVDEVGKGKMTFEKYNGDSVIETLHFDGMGDSKVYFTATKENEATKVTWGMTSKVPFFGRAFMLFMNMDKMIGPDFEKGLGMLKKAMENMKEEAADIHYDIKETNWEARSFVGKKGTFKFMELPKFFADTYPKLGETIGKEKIETIGAPSAIYFKYHEVKMETECAAVFGLKEKKAIKGWETFDIPASKVLLIEYYGAYDKSANAHYAMDAFMKEKGLSQSFVIEEYVTDPMTEKDTAKWLTNIYYVLK